MIWKEMKHFCNNLTDEQLNEKFMVMREEEVLTSFYPPAILEEDLSLDPEASEGCFPFSEVKGSYTKEEFAQLKVAYKKGTPMIWEDF